MEPLHEQLPLEAGEESPSDSAELLGESRRPQGWRAKAAAAGLALLLAAAAAALLLAPARRPSLAARDLVGLDESANCSSATADCRSTKCCTDPGYICYEKNEHYANCNATCTPGKNANDAPEHQTNWSCRALAGPACGTSTGDCSKSKCCANSGYTCYKKNEHYANCNATCTPGVNAKDPQGHQTPWDCTMLGGDNCSSATEDCRAKRCCKDHGYTCYAKNEHYANCNATCTPGVNPNDAKEHQTPWSCEVLGGHAPMPAPASPA